MCPQSAYLLKSWDAAERGICIWDNALHGQSCPGGFSAFKGVHGDASRASRNHSDLSSTNVVRLGQSRIHIYL
ncbi:hypothetical protein FR483_n511L [Paramecium bursaria Chlorella virus FR483]|uniref:Uncharacterized protein n511L n=1 Tax=Paramecium bursaria Chlorella virus FR483 TaxID=399781 RepID=A7J7L5_PBCVF|nr:hypothetical protein FR483_n511L [Paramecium bursaria Chlorella virus FR483]ABT15796.1 hypothetical protein FR483_n511L [Paramecium bursaria Chlorella virus FR483]